MARLRICQMITELRPGGAERSLYELSKRLDRRLFDVEVIALRGGIFADRLVEAGIPVSVIGVRGKWDVSKFRPLVNLLRRRRFDILHTHLFHADLAGRLSADRAAVPHLVHTVRTTEGRFRPWHFAFARFFSEHCDRIVCVSRSVRDFHMDRSGLPAHRYTVINNGIDVSAFSRDEQARRKLRGQWGLADEHPLAAFVGRLAPEKGLELLLGAMSHLAARGSPVNMVIAGDGPRRRVVENFIAHGEGGGHCRLLGYVSNVRGILSAADMLVMPSRWEGFGLAAAEAMAASLPVIGTRVAGLRDVVVDGRTGLLIESGNVIALAEAIERLARDSQLRERFGRAGQKRVAAHFDISSTVAAYEKLYLEIASS